MNRTGLLIAVACAIVVGIVFGLWPELDLALVAPYSELRDITFAHRGNPALHWLRQIMIWITAAIAAPAVIALVVKLFWPRSPMLIPGRAVVFLLATLILGPGLVVNAGLKEHWGRPRPIDVTQFGGTDRFVAWWDPRGACPENCSFVSGDAAGAFWSIAPATLAPPQWRPVAYAAAIAFGFGVGFLRMVFGGHFFSDVFFAAFFVFLVIWLVHGALYRWRATQTTDAAIDGALTRFSLAIDRAFRRLIGRDRGVKEPDA